MARIDNALCRKFCGRTTGRVYVAVSITMNLPSASQRWAGAYVFKVGKTKACWDREKSLSERRPGKPPYAGTEDWRIVGCWPADDPLLRERAFRDWARRHIGVVDQFTDGDGVKRKELYTLAPCHVFRGLTASTGEDIHDEIVEVARLAILRAVEAESIPYYDDGRVRAIAASPLNSALTQLDGGLRVCRGSPMGTHESKCLDVQSGR